MKRPRGSSWHLVPALVALCPLREGEEILYDYSDTSYRRLIPSRTSTGDGLVEADSPWVDRALIELELECHETIPPTVSSSPLSSFSVSTDSLLDDLECGEIAEGCSSPERMSMAMVACPVSGNARSVGPTGYTKAWSAPHSSSCKPAVSASNARPRHRGGRRGRGRQISHAHRVSGQPPFVD